MTGSSKSNPIFRSSEILSSSAPDIISKIINPSRDRLEFKRRSIVTFRNSLIEGLAYSPPQFLQATKVFSTDGSELKER
jgi:hypothetical protein